MSATTQSEYEEEPRPGEPQKHTKLETEHVTHKFGNGIMNGSDIWIGSYGGPKELCCYGEGGLNIDKKPTHASSVLTTDGKATLHQVMHRRRPPTSNGSEKLVSGEDDRANERKRYTRG